jgi:hypothetical protein
MEGRPTEPKGVPVLMDGKNAFFWVLTGVILLIVALPVGAFAYEKVVGPLQCGVNFGDWHEAYNIEPTRFFGGKSEPGRCFHPELPFSHPFWVWAALFGSITSSVVSAIDGRKETRPASARSETSSS